jgi:hypothetical protein
MWRAQAAAQPTAASTAAESRSRSSDPASGCMIPVARLSGPAPFESLHASPSPFARAAHQPTLYIHHRQLVWADQHMYACVYMHQSSPSCHTPASLLQSGLVKFLCAQSLAPACAVGHAPVRKPCGWAAAAQQAPPPNPDVDWHHLTQFGSSGCWLAIEQHCTQFDHPSPQASCAVSLARPLHC